jgi:hypothetical protein
MKRYLMAFLISFFSTIMIGYAVFVIRIDRPLDGATSISVGMGCELVYFDTRLQPFNTLVLMCPSNDSTRLFPLPVQHPWFQDWWNRTPQKSSG